MADKSKQMGIKRKTKDGYQRRNKRKDGKADTPQDETHPSGSTAGQHKLASKDMEDDYVHYSSDDGVKPQSDPKRPKNQPGDSAIAKLASNDEEEEEDDGDDGHGESGSGDDDDDNDDDDDAPELVLKEADEGESDVEVTLEFYDPRADDTTSVDMFLAQWSQLFQKGVSDAFDTAKLADAICAQTRVGTMVRVGEEEAPVGFTSCLNVRRYAELLSPIRETVERTAGKASPICKLLSSCFEGRGKFEREKMGLILCKRVVNFPPQVVPKLLEALFSEISWAIEDEPTLELREEYRFGWYIYITEGLFRTPSDTAQLDKSEGTGSTEDIEFFKIEDEAWWNVATHRVCWNIAGGDAGKSGIFRKAVALIIAASNVHKARKQVSEMLGVTTEDDVESGGMQAELEK